MPLSPPKYIYIDLFSGCGGLALGFHNAGWKALFAVEKNEEAFSTLKCNLIDHKNHFIWPKWLPQNVHDINELLSTYQPELKKMSGKILLVTGGPPCQGFSSAGRRNESDIRNTLVDSYLQFIDLVNPDSLLFENVRGFTLAFQGTSIEKTGKKYSEYIISELHRRGYMVEANMLNFSNFGVPQRRCRFILFASKSIKPQLFFKRLSDNIKPFLSEKGIPQIVGIKSALSDLERSNGETTCPDSKGFMSGIYGNARTSYQRYCRCGARKGGSPDSHRFAKHRPDTIKRFQELLDLNVTDCNISKLLKKQYGINKNCFSVLEANLPAPTLTSNPDDHIHYCEPRTLTVREYARIQTFPDWYLFKGSYTTGGDSRKTDVPRYTQIGNAIPPLFAEQVAITIRQLLSEEKINN